MPDNHNFITFISKVSVCMTLEMCKKLLLPFFFKLI
jgi:hypothetical protein